MREGARAPREVGEEAGRKTQGKNCDSESKQRQVYGNGKSRGCCLDVAVKPKPVVLASHLGIVVSPGCSTFLLAIMPG